MRCRDSYNKHFVDVCFLRSSCQLFVVVSLLLIRLLYTKLNNYSVLHLVMKTTEF